MQAAREIGYDPDDYDLYILAYKDGPGSGKSGEAPWNGLASIGGRGVWLRSLSSIGVAVHELSHNFGLNHANSWNTSGLSVIGSGSNVEYGNTFDTMGPATAGIHQFNAHLKNRLEWLPNELTHSVRRNGVYRVYSYDRTILDPGRRFALSIEKGDTRTYWAELRGLFGASNPWIKSGVLLNWSPWSESNGGTQLLDTTPGSPNGVTDAALTIGRTLSDPGAGVHMTPVLFDDTESPFVDLVVNLGEFPSNVAPSVAVSADQTSVAPGTEVTFTATASDPNGDTLAYHWDFGDGTFGDENAPSASKSWSSPGRYVARCLVSDMKGGIAADSVTVTVGTPSTFSISGHVLPASGDVPVNVRVHNGQSGGSYRGAFTNSDGSYTITDVPSGSISLSAVLDGHTIVPSFSNPLSVSGDLSGIDFTATEDVLVSITATDPEAVEGTDSGMFTLSRTGPTSSQLTVVVSSVQGTAARSEYTLNPDTTFDFSIFEIVFYIPAGQSSLEIVVDAPDDGQSEGPETVELVIEPTASYNLAGPSSAIVTISDPGPVQTLVSLDFTDADAREPGDDAELLVRRNGPTAGALSVNIATSGEATSGADYAPLGTSVLIPAGEESATIPITILDDNEVEGGEELLVTLMPGAGYSVSSSEDEVTVFITDDDIPTLSITAPDDSASEAGSDPATFLVTRTGDTSLSLSVPYAIAGTAQHGVDYAPLPGVLDLPAGSTSGSITIIPVDDQIGEPTQTITLQLVGSTDYVMGTQFSATATIADNDIPVVTVGAPDGTASEPSDGAQFLFTTRGSGSGPITVHYSVTGSATPGADYAALSGSVMMGQNTTSTVTVTPLDDGIPKTWRRSRSRSPRIRPTRRSSTTPPPSFSGMTSNLPSASTPTAARSASKAARSWDSTCTGPDRRAAP